MKKLQRFILSASKLTPKEYYRMSKAKKLYVKQNPECAVCGCKDHLEVHHVEPVHIKPQLAADPYNFITLCDKGNSGCHFVFGHFRNFRTKWNPFIRIFAEEVRNILEMCKDKFDIIVSNTN